MTVSVRSPRKSIFKSPSSSIVVIVNWVVTIPSVPLASGTYSSIGFCEITTPAAWVDECLGSPSKRFDISIKRVTRSSFSYMERSSGFILSARSIVMEAPGSFGMLLAMLSTNAYGKSMTRPTSRITPLAANVPNVIISVTHSFPYFSTT